MSDYQPPNHERQRDQRQGQYPEPGGGWSPQLLWFAVFAAVLAVFAMSGQQASSPRFESIPYSQFKQEVQNHDVRSVTIRGQEVLGRYREPQQTEQAPAKVQGFETTLPVVDDPELLGLLEEHNVTIHAESTKTSWWQEALVSLLPVLLIIGLLVYFGRRMQQRMGSGGQGLFGFGKTQAKRFREGKTGVVFDSVAGSEGAKRDLQEIIEYLKDPHRYVNLGASIPKGVLLMGSPGTGKTLLAKAVAGEADVPFYSISGSEFIEMFVGVGAARVRDTFKSAKSEAPSIIFIDELDSVGRARGTGLGGGHDEREQTLNQILNEMDGFTAEETVVVIAATNRPDVLDQALLRPGRFDRKVTLELPDRRAREQILRVHTRRVPLADNVDLGVIAQRTVGFSGAELQNLVNEGALLAGRARRERVDMNTLEQARDKVVLGAERESILSDEEKQVIAYHESGHALLAWLLPEADPLDKVTIIPRGRALGATEQTPEEDRHNLKRSYLLDRITVMLGGRASEKIVFADVTTGAEADLEQATQLTRRMICRWGMNEKLGPVALRRSEEHVFLGREIAQSPDFSEQTAQLIDEELRRQVNELEEKALALLRKHRAKVDALAGALQRHETLQRDDIERLFRMAA